MMTFQLPNRIAENIDNFTGRTWLLPLLLKWFEQTSDRMFILQGEPGTGKSMFVAWLAGSGPEFTDADATSQLKRIRSQVNAVHFCIESSGSITPKAFAQNVAEQLTRNVNGFGDALAATLADQIQVSGKVSADQIEAGASATGVYIERLDLGELSDELSFNRVFREPLQKLYRDGYDQPMILLVDALDEAETYTGSPSIVRLLARLTDLPNPIRVLVTTRPDPRVLKNYRGVKPFDLIADAPDNEEDVRLYAYERLPELDNRRRNDLSDHISQAAEGNFLYAHLILNEIRLRLPNIPDLDALTMPKGLNGLYQEFLNRELGEDEDRWYHDFRPVLGLIAVAQGEGLSKKQISGITGKDVEQTLRICKQYLDGDLPEGPFRLFHKSFGDYLLGDDENLDYHIDEQAMHRRIADHYWKHSSEEWRLCDEYGLDNLATHLGESRDRERLPRLISRAWMDIRYERSGFRYGGFLQDIEKALRFLQARDLPDLDALVRLHTARQLVLFRLRSTLTSSIATLLVKTGQCEETLARARLLPSPRRRCDVVLGIAAAAEVKSEDMLTLLKEVSELADTIPDLKERTEVLANCAAIAARAELSMAKGVFDRALHTARRMNDLRDRSNGLATTACRMLEVRQGGVGVVVKELIDCIRGTQDEHNFPRFGVFTKHANALHRQDPSMAKPLIDAALAETPKHADGFPHDEAAADLVRLLVTDGQPAEAERWIRNITYPRFTVSALAALVSTLDSFPDSRREQLVTELVDAVMVLVKLNTGRRRVSQSDLHPVEYAARALVEQGRYDVARKFVRSAPNDEWKACILRSLAEALHAIGDKRSGRVFGETVKTTLGAEVPSVISHRGVMRSLLAAGRLDQAKVLMKDCQNERFRDGHRFQFVGTLVRIGALVEAEILANEIENPAVKVQALTDIALVLATVGNEGARTLADEVVQLAETNVDQAPRFEAFVRLGRVIARKNAPRGLAFLQNLHQKIMASWTAKPNLRVARILPLVACEMAKQGLMPESEALFRKAIAYANNASGLHSITKRMVEAGLLDEAESLGKSIRSYSPEATFARLRRFAEQGEFDQAEKIVKGIKNKGWKCEGEVHLVRHLAGAGQVQRAESIALDIEYESYRAKALLALGQSQVGRNRDGAKEHFRSAIDLVAPRSGEWDRALVLVDMIKMIGDAGMLEMAKQTAKGIQNEEARNRGFRILATSLADHGDLVQAERILKSRIVEDFPGGINEKVRGYSALSVSAAARDPEFARRCLESARRYASGQEKWRRDEAFGVVAEASVRCGLVEQGVALLQEIPNERKQGEASDRLADLLTETGAFAEALPLLSTRRSLDEHLGILVRWTEFVRKAAPERELSFLQEACQVVGWGRKDWAEVAKLLREIQSEEA